MARLSRHSKQKMLVIAGIIVILSVAVVLMHFSFGRHKFKEFCASVQPGIRVERLDETSEGFGYRLIEGIDGPTFVVDRHKYYVPHAMFCTIELDDIKARRKAIVVSTKFDEAITFNGL